MAWMTGLAHSTPPGENAFAAGAAFNNPLSGGRIERQMRIPAGDRLVAMLGYLPVLPAILLMFKVKRTSMFAQFNIRQGFMLFLVFVAVLILSLGFLFVPVLELAGFYILFAGILLYAVMALIGIVKVLQGERYRMPLVADLALLFRL